MWLMLRARAQGTWEAYKGNRVGSIGKGQIMKGWYTGSLFGLQRTEVSS